MKLRREEQRSAGAPRLYAGPLYLQISDLLRERIRTRGWVEGQALPNEGDLAREYGVSVGTMRKALEQVEAIGWISRRQGRGTFVTNPEETSTRRLNPFFDDDGQVLAEEGAVLGIRTRVASPEEKSWLALSEHETVLSVVRVRKADGVLALHDEMAIPTRLVPGLAEGAAGALQDFAGYRSRYNLAVTRLKEAIRAVALPDEVAAAVGLPTGHPALLSRRISFNADGQPVDVCVRHAVPMAAEYRIDLS